MKYTYMPVLVISFVLSSCSDNKGEIVIDEHRQVAEACNIHLERISEIGTKIENISPEQFNEVQMMNDHVLAVKRKKSHFLRLDTSHFKKRDDVEFSSESESELFECIKTLEGKLKILASAF